MDTPPRTDKGYLAWFDSQDMTVKAALIGAIVSIIGSIAGVIVAIIKRRSS